jgi:hypothetical protein
MIESGEDIDASYDILGLHGRAEERDEMASCRDLLTMRSRPKECSHAGGQWSLPKEKAIL